MDRRELEIMLNEAFDRGIVSVGHLVHETVEVGFLNELGRTVGFTLNGWKEAIETIPVDLFDSFDDGRGREWFLSDCKALGGKVPQNTYRGELVSALADVLMVEEAAPALGALRKRYDTSEFRQVRVAPAIELIWAMLRRKSSCETGAGFPV